MKRTANLILILSVSFLSACHKKFESAIPQVKLISASPFDGDSVMLTGEVTDKGNSDVQYVGFCYSTQPNFDITQNQLLLNGTNGTFSGAVYAKLDSTYYFKCFAANDISYGVSSIFKYTVQLSPPDSASCGLSNNTVIDNSKLWTSPAVNSGPGYAPYGVFGVQANFNYGYEILNVQFKQVPVNGVYTIIYDFSSFQYYTNPFYVYATIGSALSSFPLNSGQIYIAQNKDGSTTLSFCGITYTTVSNTYQASGKITF